MIWQRLKRICGALLLGVCALAVPLQAADKAIDKGDGKAVEKPADKTVARSDDQSVKYDPVNTLLALNMAVVSVKTIVSTKDRIVLDQEYRNIINNLSLGDIESDADIVKLYQKLMDVITANTLKEQEEKHFQEKYDRSQQNAINNQISKLIPYGGDLASFCASLFSQGITAFFGYRDSLTTYRQDLEDSLWKLKKEAVNNFNELQKQLLGAAWALLRKYKLPDSYRITQDDLETLEQALDEPNRATAVQMFAALKRQFQTYPPFWFYYGQAAFRAGDSRTALGCFDEFDKVWRHVLRRDPYKLQAAKYRIILTPGLAKAKIAALLEDIRANSGPKDWIENLFYGPVAWAIGEKDKGMEAVRSNVLFKAETKISPVLLKSMESGTMDMSLLPEEIRAAVQQTRRSVNADTRVLYGDEQVQKGTAAWLKGDDAGAAQLFAAMIAQSAKNPVPYNIYSLQLLAGLGVERDVALGQKYRARGEELAKNNGSAYKSIEPLCRTNAENGNARAQFLLGEMCLEGRGTGRDEAKAVRWLHKAADQGGAAAQFDLGRCYLGGTGVKRDIKEAAAWFYLARLNGFVPAQRTIDELEGNGLFKIRKLSPENQDRARERAKKLFEAQKAKKK